MSGYQFVASPMGNGYDCHRTWEALALGCVPIVNLSLVANRGPLQRLYSMFDIWIVQDWSEVTPQRLQSWKRRPTGPLDVAFWKDLLASFGASRQHQKNFLD